MVNTNEIAAEYRLSHWAQIMKERQDSGLTIRDYCKREGCHENRYFYWQRKLRQAVCTKFIPAVATESANNQPPGWATLHLQNTPTTSEITIEVGGCRIAVSHNTDTVLLAKICRALISL
jgi:hypothetical protein